MIRMAEPLAWEVDVELGRAGRQLRLVSDEISSLQENVMAGASEAAAHVEIAQSLASFLLGLQPGSHCCWCGGTLVQGHDAGRFRLECGSCGAVIEGPESVHGSGVRL